MKKILGALIAITGLAIFMMHSLHQRSQPWADPHLLWQLGGAVLFLLGLWWVLPSGKSPSR